MMRFNFSVFIVLIIVFMFVLAILSAVWIMIRGKSTLTKGLELIQNNCLLASINDVGRFQFMMNSLDENERQNIKKLEDCVILKVLDLVQNETLTTNLTDVFVWNLRLRKIEVRIEEVLFFAKILVPEEEHLRNICKTALLDNMILHKDTDILNNVPKNLSNVRITNTTALFKESNVFQPPNLLVLSAIKHEKYRNLFLEQVEIGTTKEYATLNQEIANLIPIDSKVLHDRFKKIDYFAVSNDLAEKDWNNVVMVKKNLLNDISHASLDKPLKKQSIQMLWDHFNVFEFFVSNLNLKNTDSKFLVDKDVGRLFLDKKRFSYFVEKTGRVLIPVDNSEYKGFYCVNEKFSKLLKEYKNEISLQNLEILENKSRLDLINEFFADKQPVKLMKDVFLNDENEEFAQKLQDEGKVLVSTQGIEIQDLRNADETALCVERNIIQRLQNRNILDLHLSKAERELLIQYEHLKNYFLINLRDNGEEFKEVDFESLSFLQHHWPECEMLKNLGTFVSNEGGAILLDKVDQHQHGIRLKKETASRFIGVDVSETQLTNEELTKLKESKHFFRIFTKNLKLIHDVFEIDKNLLRLPKTLFFDLQNEFDSRGYRAINSSGLICKIPCNDFNLCFLTSNSLQEYKNLHAEIKIPTGIKLRNLKKYKNLRQFVRKNAIRSKPSELNLNDINHWKFVNFMLELCKNDV